jgi:hypothetical protein
VATGVYQIVRRYNCHEPRCWRVGTHPAADGQFLLCYRHHPDFQGKRPTHEMIERVHRHLAHVGALHDRLEEVHGVLAAGRGQPDGRSKADGDPAESYRSDVRAASWRDYASKTMQTVGTGGCRRCSRG